VISAAAPGSQKLWPKALDQAIKTAKN